MKYLLFIVFCFDVFFQPPSLAQFTERGNDTISRQRKILIVETEKTVDSIKLLITQTPDDTTKVMLLVALSDAQSNDNVNSTTLYGEQAVLLAEKLHFKRGLVKANQSIAWIYQTRKDYKMAMVYYQRMIDAAEGDVYIVEHLYSSLLNLYFYLGDYPRAMEDVTNEMEVFGKLNDQMGIAHCNNLLGYIYFKQENFDEAEKYYNRYINIARQLGDTNLLVHALGEVADVYTEEKKYTQSFNSLSSVLEICNPSLDSFGLLTKNKIKGWLFPQYKAKAMYRLGRNYKLTGNLQEAIKYSLAAVNFVIRNPVPDYDVATYYINAGDVYKEMKEYDKAISYLSFGFKLSKKIQHRENTRDGAKGLAEVYSIQKRYDSAFFFFQLFTRLKDSIVNNETKMKIAGIQGQFDVAKKDKEIFRQQQIKNLLIGSFIFLLIILFLLYNRYGLRQKNRYQKELNRQQNELFNAIAATQDKERKRIAEDIHDSLGSILSAAKLKLSSLKENQPVMSAVHLEKYQVTMQLLDEASSELRNISHNIMPATLSKLGLVAALKNLFNTISSHSGIQINFSTHDFGNRIAEETEISIYRIVLELINNIVKHAQATKVTVQLIRYPDSINLSVEDNGRGFNFQHELFAQKGIGLGNVLSRVDYLKGTINADTSPGRGTTIIIDIPYLSA